jgi:hypothetical protein
VVDPEPERARGAKHDDEECSGGREDNPSSHAHDRALRHVLAARIIRRSYGIAGARPA